MGYLVAAKNIFAIALNKDVYQVEYEVMDRL